jgi:hypothetical protein
VAFLAQPVVAAPFVAAPSSFVAASPFAATSDSQLLLALRRALEAQAATAQKAKTADAEAQSSKTCGASGDLQGQINELRTKFDNLEKLVNRQMGLLENLQRSVENK